jgi:protoheme ferro-lyase
MQNKTLVMYFEVGFATKYVETWFNQHLRLYCRYFVKTLHKKLNIEKFTQCCVSILYINSFIKSNLSLYKKHTFHCCYIFFFRYINFPAFQVLTIKTNVIRVYDSMYIHK